MFLGYMSKAIALVHALWLLAGPTPELVRWVCLKIRSFTTDFGVEMHLLEAPDVVDAYCAYMSGIPLLQCRSRVKHGIRMWPHALRLAGWSHTQGGIMKAAAQAFPLWPRYLQHQRALCKHYRNVQYRQHMVRMLAPLYPDAGLPKLLKGFTASFAKWRYETEWEVLRQLLCLRDLSENKVDPAFFANAQDQDELDNFFKACKQKDFWRWSAVVFAEIFDRLERLRKWGMVCNHSQCEELRKASNYRKHIACDRIVCLLPF